MSDDELAKIEERWLAVTKGDWYCDCHPSGPCAAKVYRETVEVYNDTGRVVIAQRPTYDCGNKKQTFTDMLAIAKAPSDVRSLIAEVRRLRAENANLNDRLNHAADEGLFRLALGRNKNL